MSAPGNIAMIRDGFVILYHQGEDNRCPGCGQAQWAVGRTTAECVFCETALPLAAPVDTVERELIPADASETNIKKGTENGITTPQS